MENNNLMLDIYRDFILRFNEFSTRQARFFRYGLDYQNFENPLLKFSGKVFSQSDEDGITFEILRRIGIDTGTFLEFGVGNGLENNTLSLLARDWKGVWFGTGQELGFDINPNKITDLNFNCFDSWVTKDNIVNLIKTGLTSIRQKNVDLISMDLDGNDYHFIKEILEAGYSPSLFIAEYNAKFIPPIKFTIEYDENFHWNGDDYNGASLSLLNELFVEHGYSLVACNISGVNAFFVKNEYMDKFQDISKEVERLFNSPKYFAGCLDVWGHCNTIDGKTKVVENIIKRVNS